LWERLALFADALAAGWSAKQGLPACSVIRYIGKPSGKWRYRRYAICLTFAG